jgi:hypothetical protein
MLLTYFSLCKKRNEDATKSFLLVTPLIAQEWEIQNLSNMKR